MRLLTCSILLVVLLTIVVTRSEGSSLCSGLRQCHAGEDCGPEPQNCVHGTYKDFCGRKVCSKGPGQRCGGPSRMLGKCGDGMQCTCDRCSGCSQATLQCDFSSLPCYK